MQCIKCEKHLHKATDDPLQPRYGIVCSSHGNYGSTVFDPVSEDARMVLHVCDECLEGNPQLVHIFRNGRKVDSKDELIR